MKPFLSGRPQAANASLSRAGLSGSETGMRVVGHQHGKAGSDRDVQAVVECVKQGEKITRLIVTCSCGEKIEIDCVYPG